MIRLLSPVAVALVVFLGSRAPQDDAKALLKALPSSKHTLLAGVQSLCRRGETPISAKFEIEDGKFSLSVYTAGKGLEVDAEHNVLQEYAGSPEAATWEPKAEVFKDPEHVARSAQQLTLMALAGVSLGDVLRKVEASQSGTAYSITPMLRGRNASFVVLTMKDGNTVEAAYDLSGEPAKSRETGAAKK